MLDFLLYERGMKKLVERVDFVLPAVEHALGDEGVGDARTEVGAAGKDGNERRDAVGVEDDARGGQNNVSDKETDSQFNLFSSTSLNFENGMTRGGSIIKKTVTSGTGSGWGLFF